nr:hypothetical protein [Tanacetum cinerariifolium]
MSTMTNAHQYDFLNFEPLLAATLRPLAAVMLDEVAARTPVIGNSPILTILRLNKLRPYQRRRRRMQPATSKRGERGNARKKDSFWVEVFEYVESKTKKKEGRDNVKNKGSKASGSSTMNDDALARLMVTEMTATEVAQRGKFMELKMRESASYFINRCKVYVKIKTQANGAESPYIGRVVDLHMCELKELKQVASVKEYHDSFIDVLNRLQHPQRSNLGCFIDGLKEDIRCMVMLFKPQTIHEAYCLAKLQEVTFEARKPKELIRTTPLPTQNKPQKEYPQEHRKDVGETEITKKVDKVVLDDVEEQKDSQSKLVNESPQNFIFIVPVGVTTNVTRYPRRIKRELLCDTSCMQDVCLSLDVDEGCNGDQKYITVSMKGKDANESGDFTSSISFQLGIETIKVTSIKTAIGEASE